MIVTVERGKGVRPRRRNVVTEPRVGGWRFDLNQMTKLTHRARHRIVQQSLRHSTFVEGAKPLGFALW